MRAPLPLPPLHPFALLLLPDRLCSRTGSRQRKIKPASHGQPASHPSQPRQTFAIIIAGAESIHRVWRMSLKLRFRECLLPICGFAHGDGRLQQLQPGNGTAQAIDSSMSGCEGVSILEFSTEGGMEGWANRPRPTYLFSRQRRFEMGTADAVGKSTSWATDGSLCGVCGEVSGLAHCQDATMSGCITAALAEARPGDDS